MRRFIPAAVAGLVLVVGTGVYLFSRDYPGAIVVYRSADEVPAPLLSGPRVSATLVRLGENTEVRRVTAPPGAGVVRVRFTPGPLTGSQTYSVRVAHEPRVLPGAVTLEGMRADTDGYLEMYLPLAGVAGHTLRVTVTPAPQAAQKPLTFRFAVAYPPTLPIAAP